MFRLLHWLTCKHRDVCQLPLPQSLTTPGPWTERSLNFKRRWNLSVEAWDERQNLSVPTPGPKDATTG